MDFMAALPENDQVPRIHHHALCQSLFASDN